MSTQLTADTMQRELARKSDLEFHLRWRLSPLIQDLRVEFRDGGIVLHGRAQTYFAREIAEETAARITACPVVGNEIEVYERFNWPVLEARPEQAVGRVFGPA